MGYVSLSKDWTALLTQLDGVTASSGKRRFKASLQKFVDKCVSNMEHCEDLVDANIVNIAAASTYWKNNNAEIVQRLNTDKLDTFKNKVSIATDAVFDLEDTLEDFKNKTFKKGRYTQSDHRELAAWKDIDSSGMRNFNGMCSLYALHTKRMNAKLKKHARAPTSKLETAARSSTKHIAKEKKKIQKWQTKLNDVGSFSKPSELVKKLKEISKSVGRYEEAVANGGWGSKDPVDPNQLQIDFWRIRTALTRDLERADALKDLREKAKQLVQSRPVVRALEYQINEPLKIERKLAEIDTVCQGLQPRLPST